MTYEIYRYIFIGGAILAAIMFIVTVLVFIVLKIPTVIGDLSGANARKAIENIRNHNESTGDKTYRSSQVNRARGKITDKITPSGHLIKNPTHSLHGAMATEKIGPQQHAAMAAPASETTILTAELAPSASETTVLSGGGQMNETTVLSAPNVAAVFTIEYEITYIHTNEVIA